MLLFLLDGTTLYLIVFVDGKPVFGPLSAGTQPTDQSLQITAQDSAIFSSIVSFTPSSLQTNIHDAMDSVWQTHRIDSGKGDFLIAQTLYDGMGRKNVDFKPVRVSIPNAFGAYTNVGVINWSSGVSTGLAAQQYPFNFSGKRKVLNNK
jgi:hypothetical protein